MKRKLIIAGCVALVTAFVIVEFTKPAGIPAGFSKQAFIRNENNEGVIRLYYAFTVADPATADYAQAGNQLPYNRHSGETTAFFFDAKEPAPQKLDLYPPHFDTTRYRPVAVYTRQQDGRVTVSKQE